MKKNDERIKNERKNKKKIVIRFAKLSIEHRKSSSVFSKTKTFLYLCFLTHSNEN